MAANVKETISPHWAADGRLFMTSLASQHAAFQPVENTMR
jgi:hypothetical protein